MTLSILTGTGPESAELASLQRELDPELRAEGLLRFAGRLERRGNEAEASAIYQSLIDENSNASARAREQLSVLHGGGAFGARAEKLLGRFVEQASDPAMLVGMGVAGSVASLARLGILARLAASPSAWLTRGGAARFLAGAGALALEAPAFTISTRFANSLLGHRQDPSLQAWGHELASGYLLLGALRLSGTLVQAMPQNYSRPLFQQAGLFAGVLVAHGAEVALRLRRPQPFDATALEALSTVLQFHVGGRLSREILGRGHAAFTREIELRGAALGVAARPNSFDPISPRGIALAFAGPASHLRLNSRADSSPSSQIMMMASVGEGSKSNAGNLSGNGNGNGNGTLKRAAAIWAEIIARDSQTKTPMLRVEGSYRGEDNIPLAMDEALRSRQGRTVLAVRLDTPRRANWQAIARDFLRRNAEMEEVVLCDPEGQGLWLGRPPLGRLEDIRVHDLGSPEFRRRQRPPEVVLGLTLRDAWQEWRQPPPIADYLRQTRLESGLSIRQVVERLAADPDLAGELKSYRMSGVEARHIQFAENAYRLPVAFPLLARLARIYGVDPRRFILSSNASQHPRIDREYWSTEHYPIYLESAADLGRVEHFRRLQGEGVDWRRSFSWLLFGTRKNPERYRRIPDLTETHRLTQGEMAAWELGQKASIPSLDKMTSLSQALELPMERVIHAANRTFYPELDMESLFGRQAIHIDSSERDFAAIRSYAENPGSPGQYVFAARKRLAHRPGRVQWTQEQGLGKNYLYERETNRVRILPSNLQDWTDLFRRLDIPYEILRALAKVHAQIFMNSPAHTFAEGREGQSLNELSGESGLSMPTLQNLSTLDRSPTPQTFRHLKGALPDLDAATLFVRAHTDITRFFPEVDAPERELSLNQDQWRLAQRFHLGSALFEYRHRGDYVDMATLAARLGVSKQTVSLYESVFVRISSPKVLDRIANLLGADRRMLYLHFNPEILDIFPTSLELPESVPIGSAAFLREANRFYDRRNLRPQLFAEVLRMRNGNRSSTKASPREFLSGALNIEESLAEKFLGEARILKLGDLLRLRELVPNLDHRRWYEHFYRSPLNFFLGSDAEGRIDYRIPEGLDLAGLERLDMNSRLEAATGGSAGDGPLRTLHGALRRGGDPSDATLAQLARLAGIDRRLLYLYYRRQELAAILRDLPK